MGEGTQTRRSGDLTRQRCEFVGSYIIQLHVHLSVMCQVKEAGPSSSGGQLPNKDIFVVSKDESSPTFTTTVATDVPLAIARMAEEILQRKQEEDRRRVSSDDSVAQGDMRETVRDDQKVSESEGSSKVNQKTSGDGGRLEQAEEGQGMGEGGKSKEPDETVVLSIWDFAGQAAYYTTHQVCVLLSSQLGAIW